MSNFKVIVALITPFHRDLTIDYEALLNIINRLIYEGVDGLLVCGTTAEAPTLSDEEKFNILEFVIKNVDKRIKIYFGCGDNNTEHTLKLCKRAQKYPIEALLLVTPYYNIPNADGLYEHYNYIAKRTIANIILYNVPRRTNVNLEYNTIAKLIENNKNIVAIKQASSDIDILIKLKREYPKFNVYTGEDALLLKGIEAELDGVISVIAHLYLPLMKDILMDYNLYDYDYIIKLINKAVFYTSSPIVIKYLLSNTNVCSNSLRLPLVPINQIDANNVDKILQEINYQLAILK
ncbi:MAG: 4-hydroxy-tetrahydrodipicolinate synthase [Erysipelotrichaceae bacterium]